LLSTLIDMYVFEDFSLLYTVSIFMVEIQFVVVLDFIELWSKFINERKAEIS